ncbi:MAG: hypothetical protein, partial [Olavius algarvensis Gamma 1 endosymbiont]
EIYKYQRVINGNKSITHTHGRFSTLYPGSGDSMLEWCDAVGHWCTSTSPNL